MSEQAGAPGSVHIVLQNKGGVGKSFVASHLAQYFIDNDIPTAVFDSDPATPTLCRHKALKAEYIGFMDGDDLDVRRFDVLMTRIVAADNQLVVLDTGSSNFLEFVSYVKANHVFEVLRKMGRVIVIHSVLTGGAGAAETLAGFHATVETLGSDHNIAWLNSFFGPVEFDDQKVDDADG